MGKVHNGGARHERDALAEWTETLDARLRRGERIHRDSGRGKADGTAERAGAGVAVKNLRFRKRLTQTNGAAASWSAAVLCRFGVASHAAEKRQRTAALQNLAGFLADWQIPSTVLLKLPAAFTFSKAKCLGKSFATIAVLANLA